MKLPQDAREVELAAAAGLEKVQPPQKSQKFDLAAAAHLKT